MAADESFITLDNKKSDLGSIKIAPRVIEVVAGIAAVQVEGVNRMRGSFSSSVNELFGRKERGKGVKLAIANGKLNVDIFVYLNYGVSVPKVALEIQSQVKQQLLFMTDLRIGAVNVHVEGMIPPKSTGKVDTDKLFDNEDKK
ncbi:Asp23/Gls24 family envelope stress response protein [Fructilactobacillus fructivorans]|uniref:Alkaline shock protein n=1 Tax=Fructilactobacillus fructivorans TaxID=1614 RepID=A0A0C1Q2V1_9LACO|nr:Asp23/Gls24 family envelope stress response protein [Fructilactobacillus fructivorans]KID42143.1 Alkaline shock protein [Fructilactobacillus fructivorans]KRK58583.1 hypothetical protein FC73_GL000138 [Fructilactobacillus fructivorans]KRN13489.1 hypothetical protein IV37_GL000212 [Fructilactobacillus fructivorans]KRN40136.1 hypothetical protein IV51_GL000318 [Fructilactobacillus fructivorans]KRN43532.1 hypothetical protein IV48_GL000137 [Fructilactobacillus fructivorans]